MMTVNTDNFDVNNWGEFVHKKALNDVIQQINQVDAEQNNAISKISDLANQASQNALNASKLANQAMQTASAAEHTAVALEPKVDSLTQKVDNLENNVDDLKNNAMMKDANAYSDFAQVSVTQINGEAVQDSSGYFNHYKIYNVNGEEFERVEFSIGGEYNGDLTESNVIQITLSDELINDTEWEDTHLLITGQSGQVLEVSGAQVNSDGIRMNFNEQQKLFNKLTGPYVINVWCYFTRKISD